MENICGLSFEQKDIMQIREMLRERIVNSSCNDVADFVVDMLTDLLMQQSYKVLGLALECKIVWRSYYNDVPNFLKNSDKRIKTFNKDTFDDELFNAFFSYDSKTNRIIIHHIN